MLATRRSFLATCLAVAAAPAIVRAGSLMRVVPVEMSSIDAAKAFYRKHGYPYLFSRPSGIVEVWPAAVYAPDFKTFGGVLHRKILYADFISPSYRVA